MNLFSNLQDDPVHVNAVSTRTRPTRPSQAPPFTRSPTPALFTHSPSSPDPYWYHKNHGEKTVNSLFRVGKLAVKQVEVPVQPAGFSVLFLEPEPEPEPAGFLSTSSKISSLVESS